MYGTGSLISSSSLFSFPRCQHPFLSSTFAIRQNVFHLYLSIASYPLGRCSSDRCIKQYHYFEQCHFQLQFFIDLYG